MFYVGLDIHSKWISVCVLSETGQVVGARSLGGGGAVG
jgi:hypothetical protein